MTDARCFRQVSLRTLRKNLLIEGCLQDQEPQINTEVNSKFLSWNMRSLITPVAISVLQGLAILVRVSSLCCFLTLPDRRSRLRWYILLLDRIVTFVRRISLSIALILGGWLLLFRPFISNIHLESSFGKSSTSWTKINIRTSCFQHGLLWLELVSGVWTDFVNDGGKWST